MDNKPYLQDEFKKDAFVLLRKYQYKKENLEWWKDLRVHSLLNQIYDIIHHAKNKGEVNG